MGKTLPLLNENIIAELVEQKVVTDTFRRLTSDKKERIYRTALKLFGKFGYDSLSVDDFCHCKGSSFFLIGVAGRRTDVAGQRGASTQASRGR